MLHMYRGIDFIKSYTVRYLSYIFSMEEKNQIRFWDGITKFTPSKNVLVIQKNSWDTQRIPCVLVGFSSARFINMSLNKDIINQNNSPDTTKVVEENLSTEEVNANVWKDYGGDLEVTVELDIICTSLIERDRLTDITSIYLAGPLAKDYYWFASIINEGKLSIQDRGSFKSPSVDQPLYKNTISFPVIGRWLDRSPYNIYKLEDLYVTLTVPLDLGEEE